MNDSGIDSLERQLRDMACKRMQPVRSYTSHILAVEHYSASMRHANHEQSGQATGPCRFRTSASLPGYGTKRLAAFSMILLKKSCFGSARCS
jgi:hypothetical protein